MTTPVSFAVVGLDHWYSALPLAAGLVQHPESRLVAVAHRDPSRAGAIEADLSAVDVTDDWRAVVDRDDVDVIASFVPVAENAEVCIRAAQAGKHLISIKPLASTVEEARTIRKAVQAAGVQFIPAETRSRETEQNRWLKQAFDTAQFGALLSADLRLSGVLPQAWPGEVDDPGWWTDPALSPGGGWIDHAIYQIDRLRWLTGSEPITVQGSLANLLHRDLQVEDYGHALFTFANGAHVSVEDTWSGAPGTWRITSHYSFERGAISLDTAHEGIQVYSSDNAEPGWRTMPSLPDDSELIQPIVDRIRDPRSGNLGTLHDAIANLAACTAFYDAAATGQRVSITAV
ncbi:Gfo/Idh/MocA family protein [Brachybacterium sp. AOP42-E1-35]|uniref:Gfo/Idh/MocA family protein n=1 Tax=Brachybacterium sp. AOP42-E1-35 TaxID=3457664 RepID=UPI00402A99EA